jgi:Protein of unknown function (DUF2946).
LPHRTFATVDCVLQHKIRRQPIAWLAWLAMALLVVAPLVSRVLPAPTPMTHAMAGGDCAHGAVDTGHPCKHAGSQDPTACCGYCVLLGQQSLLAACLLPHLLPAAPREAVAVAYRAPSLEYRGRLWGRPRGPPHRA